MMDLEILPILYQIFMLIHTYKGFKGPKTNFLKLSLSQKLIGKV